jgi:hypothetical protein
VFDIGDQEGNADLIGTIEESLGADEQAQTQAEMGLPEKHGSRIKSTLSATRWADGIQPQHPRRLQGSKRWSKLAGGICGESEPCGRVPAPAQQGPLPCRRRRK